MQHLSTWRESGSGGTARTVRVSAAVLVASGYVAAGNDYCPSTSLVQGRGNMCHLYSELEMSHLLTAVFPVHYPQPILPIDALHSKQLAASFHKRYPHMHVCRSFYIEMLYAVSSPPTMLRVQPLSASVDMTIRTPDAAERCSCDVCRADRC